MSLEAWVLVAAVNSLPLLLAIFCALNSRNPGFGLLSSHVESVECRIDRLEVRSDEVKFVLRDIQATLKDLDRRVTALEQRSSPIVRG